MEGYFYSQIKIEILQYNGKKNQLLRKKDKERKTNNFILF